MKKFPDHRQTDLATCGPTCLQNILEYWGCRISISELVRQAKTDSHGNSMFSLIKTAEKYHVKAEPFSEGCLEDLTADLPLPAIAHIIAEKAVEHYVVIYHIDGDQVYLSDPAKGLCTMTLKEFCEEWTGHLLCMSREPGFTTRSHIASPLLPFLSVVFENKKTFVWIIFLSILTLLIGTVPSYYYQTLTNTLIVEKNTNHLIAFTACTIALICMHSLFSYIRQHLLNRIAIQTDSVITLKTVSKILHLPLSYLRSKPVGDWQARIYEVSTVSSTLCGAVLSVIIDSAMAVFGVFLLVRQSPMLFALVLIATILFAVITISSNKRLQSQTKQVIENTNKENAYVTELLNGIPSIKANRLEEKCKQHTNHLRQKINSSKEMFNRTDNLRDTALELVSGILEILILAFGAYWIIHQQLTLGSVLAFASLASYFYDPILKLASMSTQLREASVSAQRLLDIWQETSEYTPKAAVAFTPGDIECSNVTFAYGYRDPVLENVTFSLPVGQMTVLAGENGTGKSTIAHLICGLYQPTDGQITFAGTPLTAFATDELRSRVLYVPQQTFLFRASIRENLIGSRTDISDDHIMELCKKVKIDDRIRSLPLQLDTVLSENGNDLSGGERQKLALVRALLQKPEYLILDESTSAMDSASREAVCRLLKELQGTITVIMITHQADMAKVCDNAVILRKSAPILCGAMKEMQNSLAFKEIFCD